MKSLKVVLLINAIIFFAGDSFGQTNVLNFESFPFCLKHLETNFFIPSYCSQPTNFKFELPVQRNNQSFVLKSPVHYTAFFCKMEVKTANALGIMIQIHAGDYDLYTGRYNFIRQ